jgi:hypothetical protein
MPGCGEVQATLQRPTSLSSTIDAYLAISRGMVNDRLDRDAVKALRAAMDALPSGAPDSLKASASKLSEAPDLKSAREAFKLLTRDLLSQLQQSAR